MTELIRIHYAYKALNSALLGGELSLGFDSGYIGALPSSVGELSPISQADMISIRRTGDCYEL